jgi:hypothetical protein
MTRVDVCGKCGTLFEEGEPHCRRCGADRATCAEAREMRELCPTYTGDPMGNEGAAREVRPLFEPRWGEPQWYEQQDGRAVRKRGRRPGGDQ